ncbi:hypothetical protein MKX01_006705 [Papaver californicum]|nr:hypothetical protein MKX01_006705 [Papaver californicum]
MAARASRNYIKDLLLYHNAKIGAFGGGGGAVGAVRHSSSVPKIRPKIPQLSKKGRIFTAAFLGIVISGGACVNTVDEATSWLSKFHHQILQGCISFKDENNLRILLKRYKLLAMKYNGERKALLRCL